LARVEKTNSSEYRGFPISPGIGIGRGAVFSEAGPEDIPQYRVPPSRVDAELSRWRHALNQTREELRDLVKRIEQDLGPSEADIFRVHLSVLEDPSLKSEVEHRIVDEKHNVESALSMTIARLSKLMEAVSDKLLMERASDIRDVGRQILAKLMLDRAGVTWNLQEKVIIVASDMSPAITVRIERDKILGFVAEQLGPTSHAAILARSLEVPAVGAVHGLMSALAPSDIIVVDGSTGLVYVNPPKETLEHYRQLKTTADARRRALTKLAGLPAVTLDGEHMELLANIGKANEIGAAVKANADGVGLFRTEFPFLSQRDMPTEHEQFELYRQVVERIAPRGVTIRVLDVGGDKFPPYITIPKDSNPYLGWRGLRLLLRHKEVFKTQLRAILRASHFGKVSILYPVVSGLEELRMAKMLVEEVKNELAHAKVLFDKTLRQGIMIEVPSAVVIVDLLLKECDFLSIGTNDLTQYILAINRNSESLAPFFDPFHPAVLRSLKTIVDAAAHAKKPVSICGELAGDPQATRLLVGMGFRQLSMTPAFVLPIKELIRSFDLKNCRSLAVDALKKETAWEVRGLLDAVESAPPESRKSRGEKK